MINTKRQFTLVSNLFHALFAKNPLIQSTYHSTICHVLALQPFANSCGCCQRLRQTPTPKGFKWAPAKRSFRRSQASSVALTRSGIRSITHQLLCKPTLQSPASSSSFTWTWEAHRRTGHWEMRSPSAPGPLSSFFITWSIVVRTFQAAPKCFKMKKGICENCVVLKLRRSTTPKQQKSQARWDPTIVVNWSYNFITPTSSIPRGGGGSFKNRKAIGEIGCCESRMAEQKQWWIELTHWLTDELTTWLTDYLTCLYVNIIWIKLRGNKSLWLIQKCGKTGSVVNYPLK